MMENDSIFTSLERLRNTSAVIVCIGNALKGDDGAGPLLYERLSDRVSVSVIDAGTVPENYIQRIILHAPEALIVVDAVDFGGLPGQVRLFESDELTSFTTSTHALSPAVFATIIAAQIPVRTYFVGIEPGSTGLGAPVSDEVAAAVEMLAAGFAGLFPVN